jgi:hypothetical protein
MTGALYGRLEIIIYAKIQVIKLIAPGPGKAPKKIQPPNYKSMKMESSINTLNTLKKKNM